MIIGSTAAQKVHPGGVITDCSCGKQMVLQKDEVEQAGRHPDEPIQCDVCYAHAVNRARYS